MRAALDYRRLGIHVALREELIVHELQPVSYLLLFQYLTVREVSEILVTRLRFVILSLFIYVTIFGPPATRCVFFS